MIIAIIMILMAKIFGPFKRGIKIMIPKSRHSRIKNDLYTSLEILVLLGCSSDTIVAKTNLLTSVRVNCF